MRKRKKSGVVPVTLVDYAMPIMLVAASTVGLSGDELPPEIDVRHDVLGRLEAMRREAGRRMGLGDVKLAGAIGAMLGPGLALLSFGLAIVVGAVLGVALLLLRVRRRMEYLPFGPFLAAAALIAMLAPDQVRAGAVAAYERWMGLFGW